MKKEIGFIISILLFFIAVLSFSFKLDPDQLRKFVIKGEPIILLVGFSLFVVFFIMESKKIFRIFSKIKNKTFILLILISVLALFLRVSAPQTHRLFFDEEIYLDMSNQINTSLDSCLCSYGDGNSCFFCEMMKWPAGHPFLFSLPFALFGAGEGVAFAFALLIGLLCVILMFFLAYAITSDEKLSLFASLLLALFPLHILWTGTTAAEPTLLFFSILAMLFIILAAKIRDKKIFFLSILSIVFVILTKAEGILFIFTGLMAFWLFDKSVFKKFSRNAVIIAFVLVLLVPYFLHFFYSWNNDSWGAPQGEKVGIQYFASNFSQNAKFWLDYKYWDEFSWKNKQLFHPLAFTLLALLGIVYLIIKKKRKILLMLLFWFFSFFFFYTFFYAGSVLYGVDVRYVLTQIPSFCLFGAFGLSFLEHSLKKTRIQKNWIFPLVILIPLAFFSPYFNLIKIPASQIEEARDSRVYHNFAVDFAKSTNEDCYFASHVTSIYAFLGKKHIQTWYSSRSEFEEKLQNDCVIFDDGYWCQINAKESSACVEFEKYDLELLSQFKDEKSGKVFSFYKILAPK